MNAKFLFSIAIGIILLTTIVVKSSGQHSNAGPNVKKSFAIYAPRPKYERSWPEGAGLFLLKLEKTGVVLSVDVLKSTGYKILDESAIETLKRWRFQAGTVQQITVPMSFTHWEHFKRRGDRGDFDLQ